MNGNTGALSVTEASGGPIGGNEVTAASESGPTWAPAELASARRSASTSSPVLDPPVEGSPVVG